MPFDGGSQALVPLPFLGQLYDASADPGRDELSFSLQSWMRSLRFYIFDPTRGTLAAVPLFREMLAISPYHNIKDGTRYPAVLVLTAINDEAVGTWQPAKLVARLQAATASGKPVLLRVDWGSGHFGGTTTSDQETQTADAYSFMLWQMGIEGFQPNAGTP